MHPTDLTSSLSAVLRCATIASLCALPCAAQSGLTELVSKNDAGVAGNGYGAHQPRVSADGQRIVFGSASTNLIANDANGLVGDVFVYDRASDTVSLINVRPNGSQSPIAGAGLPDISADGRWVTFDSSDPDLVPGLTGFLGRVFVRDLTTATTSLVSWHANGTPAGFNCSSSSISSDGTHVAFRSQGALVSGIPAFGGARIYVRDLVNGVTLLATPALGGGTLDGHCWDKALSGDGRYVAFESEASNLVPGDSNGVADIFLTDLLTGQITRISEGPANQQADKASTQPFLSDDGNFVLYTSSATNLVPNDTNGSTPDVFLHDRTTGQTRLVSQAFDGQQLPPGSRGLGLAPDGASALFHTRGALLPSDVNGPLGDDVYLRDLVTDHLELVSLSSAGAQQDAAAISIVGDLSHDGTFAVFATNSGQLTPCVGCSGDPSQDLVYIRDRSACPQPVTYCATKIAAPGCVPRIFATGNPSLSGPDDFHVRAEQVVGKQFGIMIWSSAGQAMPFGGGNLCVSAPKRTPGQFSGGVSPVDCTGTYAFHVSQAFLAGNGVSAGQDLYFQYWQRDPGFATPATQVGLTGGLNVLVCP